MANKKVSQLVSKPSVLVTDLFPIADPTTGQLFKTTISDLGTAIGSGVSSVNTLVGAVVLDTDDIQELASPTNRWFTDTRARAAISGGTGISYNSGTGVITNAVTSGQIATALGYTPANGANYLLLAGGTMGGAITGTIATFASSTSVTALGITLSGASGDGVKITHSAGRAFNIQSSGSGFGILINNETASTSAPFTIQKQGLAVITLTDAGAGSFASSLTANSFIKTSGTSAQFLKADGSVDSSVYALDSAVVKLTGNQTIAGQKTFSSSLFGTSGVFSGVLSGTVVSVNGDNTTNAVSIVHNSSFNTLVVTQSGAGSAIYATGKLTVIGTAYISGQLQFGANSFLTNLTQTITLPTSSGTLALTSQLSSYLPLAGGTLTGALSGTSATFSGSLAVGGSISDRKLTVQGADDGTLQIRMQGTASTSSYCEIGRESSSTGDFRINVCRTGTVINALRISDTTGAATFASTIYTPNFISSDTEFRLGAPFARVATLDSSSGFGGGYNLNWNNASPVHNSTGALAGYGYGAGGSVSFYTNSSAAANTAVSPRMHINSSGNVGIGTTSPGSNFSEILQVAKADVGRIGIQHTNTTGSRQSDILFSRNSTNIGQVGIIQGNGTFEDQFWIRNVQNIPTIFWTNDFERMRITSGGYAWATNLTYSGSSANHQFNNSANGNTIINFYHQGTDPYGLFTQFTGAAPNNTTNYFAYFRDTSGAKCVIFSNGNIQNSNNSYGAISDIKLKENITDASSKLTDLLKVKIRNYNLIGDTNKQIGVIAQELEEVFPSLIEETEDRDNNGYLIGTKTKSVKYSVFVPMLIKAVQELSDKITTLENK